MKKVSDLLKGKLSKAKPKGKAFSIPVSPVPEARLNPSPTATSVPPTPPTKAPAKDRRKKTKGILFRMTPELYIELARCAYTDGESKTITRILTRGAMMEIQRIRAKYPEGLKSPPPDSLSDLEKELFG